MPRYINEENLFLAVVQTIGQMGIEKATTKQIAKAAQVNEVTLFRKYGTKLGLIQAAFEHIMKSSPLQGLKYSGALEADLLGIVKAYQEMSAMYGEVIPLLLAEVPRNPELRGLLDPFLRVMQSISKIVLRYQQEGMLIREPGFSAVSVLLGPIMVSRMLQRTNPGIPVVELEPQGYVRAFLAGRKPD